MPRSSPSRRRIIAGEVVIITLLVAAIALVLFDPFGFSLPVQAAVVGLLCLVGVTE